MIFFIYFCNKEISYNIPSKFVKFKTLVGEDDSEGRVSQSFYLGPSFCFIKYKKVLKMIKSHPFFR